MAKATITSKGQVTIPLQVRTAMGLESGDRIEFFEVEKGQFAIIAATGTVRDLEGMIRRPATPVSIEEMNAVIAARGLPQRKSKRR